MKKIISKLLLAAILLSLVSCSDESLPSDSANDKPSDSDQTTETLPTGESSGVPDGTNFNGETISVWYTATANAIGESFIDIAGELTGDVLSDKIYNNNRIVEQNIGVKFDFYNSGIPSNQAGNTVRTLVMADDNTYDAFFTIQYNSAQLAVEGLYLNVSGMPYLSLDKPWWDADYMNEMTIGNEVIYGLVGDYSIDRTRCLSSMFYNKKLSGDFYGDPDAICNDVIDGKWTFDRLAQISAEVYSDVNNDGKPDRGDRVGYCINDYSNLDCLFYGTGARATTRDKDDFPVVSINTERTADVCDRLYKLVYNTTGGYFQGHENRAQETLNNLVNFSEDNSMFLFGFLYNADGLRDMKSDFGIIPYPKLDENQESYHSITHDIMRIMFLPRNCGKPETVCAALEELAFIGWNDTLPTYYNTILKNKYSRDESTGRIIDLIRDDCTADIAFIYNDAFNSVGYIYRTLIQNESNAFASTFAKNETRTNEKISEFIEEFSK